MKKLLVVLLALGALTFAPADAFRERSCGKKVCHKKVAPCPKKCAPKCTTTCREEFFYTPCTKMVEVQGQCKNKRLITNTHCESVEERCIGGCEASCANEVGRNSGMSEGNGDMEMTEEMVVE